MVSQAVRYIGYVLPLAITWILAVTGMICPCLMKDHAFHIWLTPVYVVIALGIYALTSVIYGVCTFNDCQQASDELKEELVEARRDLTSKGMKFD